MPRSTTFRANPERSRQRGAALLLLLAVAGVGAASVLISALKGGSQDLARQRATLQALADAREALTGYAAAHGRLPRPAASALDGQERAAPCDSEQSCTGFLPWVTLGLPAGDAWGKLLRYSITPMLTADQVQPLSALGSKTVQRRDNRGNLAYVAGQDVCDVTAPCAALVVYSSGRHNLGTSVAGVAQANAVSGNTDELNNEQASSHFVLHTLDDNPSLPGGPFDDLVSWIPLKPLQERIALGQQ